MSYAHTTGTTVLHLAKGAVPSIRFPLPSEKLVRAFDLLAAPILTGIQDAERENETFAARRDTLLPNVIFGEQRVLQAAISLARIEYMKRIGIDRATHDIYESSNGVWY